MKIGKLFNPMGTFFVPIGSIRKFVIDPFTAAGLDTASNAINSTLNWVFQSGENHKQRKFQREENQKNRDWQREENQKARDYNTEMWEKQNLYNTPSAQRERLREAGYNPWMSGSGSPQSVAGAAAPSPSNSPAQTGVFSPLMSPGTFLGDVGSKLLRGSQIKAETANQSAETLTKLLDAYREARKNGMSKYDALGLISPYLKSLGSLESETNRYLDLIDSEVSLNKSKSDYNDSLTTWLPKTSQSEIDKNDQLITESAAKIGKMASDAKVNDAEIDRKAAEEAKLIAEKNHLNADADTINAIRNSIALKYQSEARIEFNNRLTSDAETENLRGYRDWQRSKDAKSRRAEAEKIRGHYNTRVEEAARTSRVIKGTW